MLSEEDRATAIGNMHKKFVEDRTCGSEDMIADRHTQSDRQTRSSQYCAPLSEGGGVKCINRRTWSQLSFHPLMITAVVSLLPMSSTRLQKVNMAVTRRSKERSLRTSRTFLNERRLHRNCTCKRHTRHIKNKRQHAGPMM